LRSFQLRELARNMKFASQIVPFESVIASVAKQSRDRYDSYGLLRRGACHRARIRATRWLLAMTANTMRLDQAFAFLTGFLAGSASAAFRIDLA
jgi:hypothetical protein